MKNDGFLRTLGVAVALLGMVGSTTLASTFRVATNGTDSATCGAPASPCATLQTAIDNAKDADTILVGPGRYPIETVGDECGIVVYRDLSIRSVEGAETTFLVGEENNADPLVCIESDGVTFGLATKGFTLIGQYTGLEIGLVTDVRVGGNISVGHIETGFRAFGSGHTFFRNIAKRNEEDGFELIATDTTVSRNQATYNVRDGFGVRSTGGAQDNHFEFNVADGNEEDGFVFDSNTVGNTADRNVASNNDGNGFLVRGEDHLVRRLVAIGNGGSGIDIRGSGHTLMDDHLVDNEDWGLVLRNPTTDITVTRNNLFGNRFDTDDCQLNNESGELLNAPDNFFGMPVPGPGATCGPDAVDLDPISGSDFTSAFGWLPLP